MDQNVVGELKLMNHKESIIFVCLGNICRSPAAEGVFKSLLLKHELDQSIDVDSAGTCANHIGENPDPRMLQATKARAVELTCKGRQFIKEDFNRFDRIIVMDDSNFENVSALDKAGEYTHKISKMTDYSGDKFKKFTYVPDPYFGGADGFELVLDLLEDSCENLLNEIKKNL